MFLAAILYCFGALGIFVICRNESVLLQNLYIMVLWCCLYRRPEPPFGHPLILPDDRKNGFCPVRDTWNRTTSGPIIIVL